MFNFFEGLKFGAGCILTLCSGALVLPITVTTGVRIAQQIGVIECIAPQVQNQK